MSSMSSQEEKTSSCPIRWVIRPMKHEDIKRCLVIWSRVGLTEAYETVASCLTVDPFGFYVAELAENGEVVGMCTGTLTRVDTAFMGFYAVEPEYQGLGIGKELWSATLGRLDEHVNVGLYGVPSMSEKYKKAGFVVEDSIRLLIYESKKGDDLSETLKGLKNIEDLIGCRLVVVNRNSSEVLFKKLVDYDQSVQKFSREKLLRVYLKGDDIPLTLAIVKDHSRTKLGMHSAFDQHNVTQIYTGERKSSCCAKPSQEAIIEDEALSTTIKSCLSLSATNLGDLSSSSSMRSTSPINIPSIVSSAQQSHDSTVTATSVVEHLDCTFDILGYGCIRLDNNSGGMIGPLYADSSDLCEVLLRNLMERFNLKTDSIFSAMPLSSNKHSSKILQKAGLHEIEQCSRIFTKFVPAVSLSKIYYVHSPNFTLV